MPAPVVHFRCPAALRDRLHDLADEQGVSTNMLMVSLLSGAVGFGLADDKKSPRAAVTAEGVATHQEGPDDQQHAA